jgi:TetR/AcrR family transcriptional regulator, acrAB operon repressor
MQVTRARRLYSIALTKCESAPETRQFCERIHRAGVRAETQIEAASSCAVSRGQLRDDLDTKQAAAFIHAALSGYFRKRLLMPGASTDSEIEQIVAIALRCIDTDSIAPLAPLVSISDAGRN